MATRAVVARLVLAAFLVALASAVLSSKAEADEVISSWYGPGLYGNLTASGEVFNAYDYTAAHNTLPLGTLVEVCYESCVVVEINDRGPFVGDRSIDLGYAAARDVGLLGVGVDVVSMEVIC